VIFRFLLLSVFFSCFGSVNSILTPHLCACCRLIEKQVKARMTAQVEQQKLKKRLEALLKLPENQICADCKKRGMLHIFVRCNDDVT
jgi:hypothetical protein